MSILVGDCIEVMPTLPEASVDAVCTDPPYGIEFMGRDWDGANGFRRSLNPKDVGRDDVFGRTSRSGPEYRAGVTFQAWCTAWAAEALRVTKPGGYLLAFGGTRTHHRLVCGLEDAGWIIRDELTHIYASGFPKSHNVSTNERFCQCQSKTEYRVRPVRDADVPAPVAVADGGGPVLFPDLSEPGLPAPQDRAVEVSLRSGQPGVEGRGDSQTGEGQLRRSPIRSGIGVGAADGPDGRVHHGAPAGDGRVDGSPAGANGSGQSPGPRSESQRPVESRTVAFQRDAQGRGGWPVCDRCGKPMVPAGLGTALKPAHEPIILARKPLTGSVAENVERHGTGALNIDATRIPSEPLGPRAYADPSKRTGATIAVGAHLTAEQMARRQDAAYDRQEALGRWPSNVLLSDPELFDAPNPDVVGSGAVASSGLMKAGTLEGRASVARNPMPESPMEQDTYGDTGGYSRFFIVPKADRGDREPVLRGQLPEALKAGYSGGMGEGELRGLDAKLRTKTERENSHPTVKPVDLMRHLVRLVTPPGGVVLDPFLGSGSTAIACELEGFAWIGIEKEESYVAIAEARLNGTQRGMGLSA